MARPTFLRRGETSLREEIEALRGEVADLRNKLEAQRTICRECGHTDHQVGHHFPACTRRGCDCPRFT